MVLRSIVVQPYVHEIPYCTTHCFSVYNGLDHWRRLRDNSCLPQILLRLRLEGHTPRLKAFDKTAAAGVPVSDVKGSHAMRVWNAYYAAGKE
jgi:hypothetical protein